jgi:hypothetical protein
VDGLDPLGAEGAVMPVEVEALDPFRTRGVVENVLDETESAFHTVNRELGAGSEPAAVVLELV